MWSTFWITLERRIHLIFMVANFLLMAYGGEDCTDVLKLATLVGISDLTTLTTDNFAVV